MTTSNVNDSDGYVGPANETTDGEEFNTINFLINQVLNGKWTISLALVDAVNNSTLSPPLTVNIQPMVNQLDGQGKSTPHGIINNVPVFVLQGGANGFIADPVKGDIGIMACASRDISAVKANQAPSNPGSFRTFDPADALYLGTFIGKSPTRYVQVSDDAINMVFSASISIKLSSDGITLKAGSAEIIIGNNGTITLNGIVWDTHVHEVTAVGAPTGPPEP